MGSPHYYLEGDPMHKVYTKSPHGHQIALRHRRGRDQVNRATDKALGPLKKKKKSTKKTASAKPKKRTFFKEQDY